MSKHLKWILICSVALVALTLFFVFIFSQKGKSHVLTLYGNVDVRQVELGFRVSGKVEELLFEEGDLVQEGDLVATLEKDPYDSELEKTKAQLAMTKTSFENAQILLDRRLALIDVGGVSEEDVDNATTKRNELFASLVAAEADVKKAEDTLSYTKIFAPTQGVILSRIKEPGTALNATEPVYTLSVSSPIWIRAYVSEPQLGKIYYGMKAKIFTDSQKSYEGNIGFISPVAEFTPKTVETSDLRTDLVYRLRIYVKDPDHYLKQGMPVTVKLKLNE